jgi:hypothetical protein
MRLAKLRNTGESRMMKHTEVLAATEELKRAVYKSVANPKFEAQVEGELMQLTKNINFHRRDMRHMRLSARDGR